MSSRSRKILELVKSECKNLLDLPKYESTKGTSREDQAIVLLAKNIILKSSKPNRTENMLNPLNMKYICSF